MSNPVPDRFKKRNLPTQPYPMPNPLPEGARIRETPRVPEAAPHLAPGGVVPAPGFNPVPR